MVNKKSIGRWFKTSCCSCGHFKMRYRYYKWFRSQVKHVDVSFALSHDMPLRKLSSGLWFGTLWRSCELPVMTMLQNAISVLQMISFPIKTCGFSFALSWHAIEQIVKRTVIWDAMALMWIPCNDDAANCDFGITNDNVSNQRVLMFPLLLVRIWCSTNNRVAGDLTLHDALVVSL